MEHSSLAKKPRIAIVGGGMVGVSLALLLSRQACAWDITLIETLPLQSQAEGPVFVPSFDARSTALSAGSADIFKACGLWEDLCQHCEPIGQVHISDRGHYNGSLIEAADHHLEALGYVIENQWLGQVLLHHLRQTAVDCISPATVERLQPIVNGARLTIKSEIAVDTEIIEADLVLIADGADSPLRQALGIDTRVHNYQQSAIIANIACAKPHQNIAYERFTSDGPLALLPLTDCDNQSRYAIVWTHESAAIERIMKLSDAEFIAHLQQVASYRIGHIEYVGERHCYPLTLVQAHEQVRSSIAVLGNAAHFLHPVAGQGFNLALRDSVALVDVLVNAYHAGESLGSLAVLKRYEQRQLTDQQLTIHFSDQAVKLFSSHFLPVAVLRQLGLLSLNVMPHAHEMLAKQLMGKAAIRPHHVFSSETYQEVDA